LYGAYRFAEHLGVRFFLHGDVIPDERIAWELPDLDETQRPLFNIRGVNPWGSHVFGFDAWNAEDYVAIIGQLAKMRMNFIGLHCYPEGKPYAEPTVWHGLAGEFDVRGRVLTSYVSSYYNTLFPPRWGNKLPGRTSGYHYGAARLFARDDWAPDSMIGQCPRPSTPEGCNAVFNRTADVFREAFGFARTMGVKTCIGTEAALTIPAELAKRLKAKGIDPNSRRAQREIYEATFRRIAAAHPLDYYWIWTPEGWTWQGNSSRQLEAQLEDIRIAIDALEAVGSPFKLATSGWVLGPKQDRAYFDAHLPKNMPVSSLSRGLGHQPIDEAFGRVKGREKWAIPWLEGDNNLATPQLWVGRGRIDAADALAYGCTGLLCLHWRTRVVDPSASAIAQAGWDQRPWNPKPGEIVPSETKNASAKATDKPARGQDRSLSTVDFYNDWAAALFGSKPAKDIAAVFVRIDSQLPQVTTGRCPSALRPDARPWQEVKKEFAFVDDLAACRPKVSGEGNVERFEYWLGTLRHMRATARLRCTLGVLVAAEKALEKTKDPAARKKQAVKTLLPVWRDVIARYGEAYRELLATVSTKGTLGTIVYWEHVFLPRTIAKFGRRVEKATGVSLGDDLGLPTAYEGPSRLYVEAVRTHVEAHKPLAIRATVLSRARPARVTLRRRKLGDKRFVEVSMDHVARGVYAATVPAEATGEDFEYCIRAEISADESVVWPATAPRMNQTVVILPTK